MKKFVLVLFMILLSTISLFGQGNVDWERRVVSAEGIGAPNPNAPNMAAARAGAINAAKMMALRDLIATVKGMYISSENTVENYMTTSDIVKGQVEGIARAFRQVGSPKYLDDGSVTITIEMSIDGDLSSIAMGGESFGSAATSSSGGTVSYGTGPNSGLIIDCSALSLRPALSPKIVDETGREVYGSANVSRDFAVQQGMMGYLKSLDKAKANTRIGGNPIVVRAISTSGANKTDIVISNADAAKIMELSATLNFLRECRVIAIIK